MVEQADAVRRARASFTGVLLSLRLWWRHSVVNTVDQSSVIENRREEAVISARYMFMLAMSAGIAVLGLLLSSPAVVIGAMLLSPLMGPIIGLGFALATGDYAWLRKSLRALALGTALAIAFTALIVALSPLQTVTPEIAARTRPNLFDLFIAFFSALAGAYAMIRGREGTVVGVAIATALMPPLAVVGFGLATLNWTVFSGALLLYITNLITIALTAMMMARLYGFRSNLSEKQTRLQDVFVIVAFTALAVPLGLSLVSIARETNATRQANTAILDSFPGKARISQIDIDYQAEPVSVSATVLTPELMAGAEDQVSRRLSRIMGGPVVLTLDQFQVGTSASAAEKAQLAAARAKEQEATDREVRDLVGRLALIAGVKESDVLVDREGRRAQVNAVPLPDAELATYAELETRIVANVPNWTVKLVPPAGPLPTVTLEEPQTGDDGAPVSRIGPRAKSTLDLIVWSAARIAAPIVLSGGAADVEIVRAALAERGVRLVTRSSGRDTGTIRVAWARPDEATGEQ
ncbi:DUF389 domain-containing protein [Croceicoccus naphthovorans]|uniref:Membrane protein n=1 Tax=Croceicoccus naphthovorans TaxID=1348774 RepID=A0A0G3XG03_9SPHN|nr:DUF389 domain-containing protein [Croceicoccus naphthovorans]AKM09546.1 membrane protein [Croceicoccus naphthovorans]MBB3989696.1 putative hydrophobic protein (TIGR00271 family) [Croceicoccus naphthovorans]